MGTAKKTKPEKAPRRKWIPFALIAVLAVTALLASAGANDGVIRLGPYQQVLWSSRTVDYPRAEQLALDNNDFAFNLHRQLVRSHGGSFTCSPFSVSMAMAIVYAGAKGKTRDEIQSALNFTLSEAQLAEAFADQGWLTNRDAGGMLANSLWLDTSFEMVPAYRDLVEDTYNSLLTIIDFSQKQAAIDRINQWTAKVTNNKIRKVISAEEIDALTVLVLVNCIDLDMQWDKRFDERRSGFSFSLEDGNTVPVEMMERESNCGYHWTEDYTAGRLPFSKGDGRSMIVIVPNHFGGLARIEAGLNADFLADLNDRFVTDEVMVKLPPFKMESRLKLIPALKSMGVQLAFDSQHADFSGIGTAQGLGIYIYAIVQQAMTEVDEQGVKAAAATAISMNTLSAAPPMRKMLIADRPFLFIVQDTSTGAVLFIGRVVDPSAI